MVQSQQWYLKIQRIDILNKENPIKKALDNNDIEIIQNSKSDDFER